MSSNIETAIAIAFFGTSYCYRGDFPSIAIAIGIAKTIPKLLLMTSFFHIEVSASETEVEGYKKDQCGLKQSHIHLREVLQPYINPKAAFMHYCY